ncbi:hypothetical protein D3C84_1000560 [compost metagenome]
MPALPLVIGIQHHAALADGDQAFTGLFQVEQQHLVGGDGIVECRRLGECRWQGSERPERQGQ